MPPIPQPVVMINLTWPQSEVMLPELAREVGDVKAAHVYQLLAEDLVLRLRAAASQAGMRLYYYAGPVQNLRHISMWLNDGQPPIVDAAPAVSGSEADKLDDAIRQAFSVIRAPRAVVVQPLSPDIDAADVARALDLLNESDAVLGRTEQGGIYLVAARQSLRLQTACADEAVARLAADRLKVDSTSLPVRRAVKSAQDVRHLAAPVRNRLQQLAAFRQIEVDLLG